jgi:hypothetical protein
MVIRAVLESCFHDSKMYSRLGFFINNHGFFFKEPKSRLENPRFFSYSLMKTTCLIRFLKSLAPWFFDSEILTKPGSAVLSKLKQLPKSISTGAQYVTQTVKFIVKKSKCAGLAQEIRFSAPNSCSLPWLVNGATQLCTSKNKCNKLDPRTGQYF